MTMKKTTRWIVIGLIALVVVGIIVYPSIKKKRETKANNEALTTVATSVPRSRALNVNAEVIGYSTMVDYTVRPGRLIPFEESALTFETSGKVTGIFFEEGQAVKKGTLLAKINDAPLQAQLKKLEAQVKLAEDRVSRQKTLLEKDAVSLEAYETVETEYKKLMADIELVKANIAQTELRAPFDGRIGLRYVSEGAYVSPSTHVATISMTNTLKLDFAVPDRYAQAMRPGVKVMFTFQDGRGITHEYRATVYAVESSVVEGTYSLNVRATFPNESDNLVAGSFVSINIIGEEIANAISVPSEAIIPEMGRNMVYVSRDGKAKPVYIETGMRDESRVQALSGLQIGDTLITSGVMQLRTDTPVILNIVK